MLIYRVTNRMNGKVYVGKTMGSVNWRWNEHRSKASAGFPYYFYRAIRKYGPESFLVEVIGSANTPQELSCMETEAILAHRANQPNHGYNMTQGGDGTPGYRWPMPMSAGNRARCSERSKKVWESHTDEEKTRIREHMRHIASLGGKAIRGIKRPPETCLAISNGRKGIGCPQTKDSKRKIASTLQGRKRPPEVVKRVVEAKLRNRLARLATSTGE